MGMMARESGVYESNDKRNILVSFALLVKSPVFTLIVLDLSRWALLTAVVTDRQSDAHGWLGLSNVRIFAS